MTGFACPEPGAGGWGPSCLLTSLWPSPLADGILSFLKDSKPGDALCVLGLTLSDLYPCEAWSFTFGKFLPGHGEPGPRQPLPQPVLGGGVHPGAQGWGGVRTQVPALPGKMTHCLETAASERVSPRPAFTGRDLAAPLWGCGQGRVSGTWAS